MATTKTNNEQDTAPALGKAPDFARRAEQIPPNDKNPTELVEWRRFSISAKVAAIHRNCRKKCRSLYGHPRGAGIARGDPLGPRGDDPAAGQ